MGAREGSGGIGVFEKKLESRGWAGVRLVEDEDRGKEDSPEERMCEQRQEDGNLGQVWRAGYQGPYTGGVGTMANSQVGHLMY